MFENILVSPSTLGRLHWYVQGNAAAYPSLVLLGEKGIGKSLIAKELASWLLGLPIGVPPICAIDYYEVGTERPDSLKEQMEEAVTFVSFAPVQAKRRVVVINDAELVRQSALLKLLEDQAKTCVFILVTSKELLHTIYSRCLVLATATPTREDLLDFLTKNGEPVDELLLMASGGRLGFYKQFMEDEVFRSQMAQFVNTFSQMHNKRELLEVCGALKEKDPNYYALLFNETQMRGFFHLLEAIFRYILAAADGVPQALPVTIRPDLVSLYSREQAAEILFTIEKHSRWLATKGRYSKNDFFDMLMLLVE